MKSKTAFLTALLFASVVACGQELSGSWEGIISRDTWRAPQQYYVRLQFVQIDRLVRGTLSISNSKTDAKPEATYVLSGEVPKQKGKSFRLYREAIGETFLSREMAEYFNDLEIAPPKQDTAYARLTGFWFPNVSNGTLPNGAAGRYAVAKVSDSVTSKELLDWQRLRNMEKKMEQQ